MKLSSFVLASVLLLMNHPTTTAQTPPSRKDLLHVLLTEQSISQIEVKQVTLLRGQSAPKHSHPCPVIGYIASGRVLFQLEGEEKQIIGQGEAFFEPKDKVVLHFDNASTQEPLTFIAFYLKEANEDLIKLLK
jgi:quercetin dioxygenase-like cupin family protein